MKREILLSLGAIAALGLSAAPITPDQALSRLGRSGQNRVTAAQLTSDPVWTAKTAKGTNTAYVFNTANGKGFRVLAANDVAYAVLGYSDDGSFDPNNISPEFQFWMDRLGAQIAEAEANGATTNNEAPEADEAMAAIPTLMTTKWDQGTPYNNLCPKSGNRLTYTGCVATSMAQVMNYHKYPETGEGSISYQWGANTLKMDFSTTRFDWANMLNSYSGTTYNSQQATAVATLMKAAGHSVQMNYGTNSSGTQGSLVADALKTYFKYDPNVNVKYRVVYSASEWAKMVWENLKNCGPLVLNGHPYQDSGHSFVCDGYDGKGYFHINWGWGGMSDGYYLLEALAPGAQGIGGSSGGFNYGLNGIFGIQKPTGQPVEVVYDNMLMYGGVTAEFSGQNIQFYLTPYYPSGWYCAMGHSILVNMGIIIEPILGAQGETRTQGGYFNGGVRVSLSPGSYYPSERGPYAKFPTNLPDGTYKVTIGVRDLNIKDAPYFPILHPYGVPNYVIVKVENGTNTIINQSESKLIPENLVLDSDLYYGKNARYVATLKNETEFELTETLAPGLLKDGKLVMVAGVAPTTVAPDSSEETEWVAKMVKLDGVDEPTVATEYTLAIVNPITNEILGTYGTVTMKPAVKIGRLAPDTFVVENCTKSEYEVAGNKVQAYDVPSDNFTSVLKYSVTQGFFDGQLSVNIAQRNPEDYFDVITVKERIFSYMPFIYSGTEETVDIPVSFPEGEAGKVYMLVVKYTFGTSESTLTNLSFVMKQSGIEDVLTDQTPVRYFNLQGIEIETPVKGQVVIMKRGDKTCKVLY